METGLRGTDVCSLTLENIDWEKDVIYIIQEKTKRQLTLPLRATYGNAIYDYLLTERPKDGSKYVFLRSLAPYRQLKAGAIYSILKNMEALAGIQKDGRVTGSRMTRHNAASAMLRAGVSMSDISAALGHRDPNIVSAYLSTDAKSLAACTLSLPSVGEGGVPDVTLSCLPCSVCCIAAVSGAKKCVALHERTSIWLKDILTSYSPKDQKTVGSTSPVNL